MMKGCSLTFSRECLIGMVDKRSNIRVITCEMNVAKWRTSIWKPQRPNCAKFEALKEYLLDNWLQNIFFCGICIKASVKKIGHRKSEYNWTHDINHQQIWQFLTLGECNIRINYMQIWLKLLGVRRKDNGSCCGDKPLAEINHWPADKFASMTAPAIAAHDNAWW